MSSIVWGNVAGTNTNFWLVTYSPLPPGALPKNSKIRAGLIGLEYQTDNKFVPKPTSCAKPPEGEGGVRVREQQEKRLRLRSCHTLR
jgi:hypothetical protein